MSKKDELLIPDAAKRDPKSFLVLRVWVANKDQHVSLRAGVWEDPATWGIFLSDLMGHIANAYEQAEGLDRLKTRQRIREGLKAELDSPTDRPSGRMIR